MHEFLKKDYVKLARSTSCHISCSANILNAHMTPFSLVFSIWVLRTSATLEGINPGTLRFRSCHKHVYLNKHQQPFPRKKLGPQTLWRGLTLFAYWLSRGVIFSDGESTYLQSPLNLAHRRVPMSQYQHFTSHLTLIFEAVHYPQSIRYI